jgi:hypothetical protein
VPAANVLGDAGQGLQVLQSVQHQNKFMMTAGVVTSLKYAFYIINIFNYGYLSHQGIAKPDCRAL